MIIFLNIPTDGGYRIILDNHVILVNSIQYRANHSVQVLINQLKSHMHSIPYSTQRRCESSEVTCRLFFRLQALMLVLERQLKTRQLMEASVLA